jgi:hypothetical protein
MHLTEESSQMDYFLFIMYIHDCFQTQMILAYSWFGFNAMIVTCVHLFENLIRSYSHCQRQ